VVSINGNPAPNYYNPGWVQWSIKSPLLAHLAILTSAIYQAEAQNEPPGQSLITLRYKVKRIELLNGMLVHEESATSPEAIAGVLCLIANEGYWCNRDVMQNHMVGLKEMIRLRGVLDNLGLSAFMRKMILQYVLRSSSSILFCKGSNFLSTIDYNVACSHDIKPAFLHVESTQLRNPVEMSIPYVAVNQESQ